VSDVRTKVGSVGDLAVGQSLVVEAAGRSIAVFNVDGSYYAIDNSCPHRGGPLGEGDLAGRVISCPWHAWRWDVSTGANVNNPAVGVACFAVHVQGDSIFVDISADAAAAGGQGV
jgi:nitrite reductase (NADH) small subunit